MVDRLAAGLARRLEKGDHGFIVNAGAWLELHRNSSRDVVCVRVPAAPPARHPTGNAGERRDASRLAPRRARFDRRYPLVTRWASGIPEPCGGGDFLRVQALPG